MVKLSDDFKNKKTGMLTRRNFLKFVGGTIAVAAMSPFSQLTVCSKAKEDIEAKSAWKNSHAVFPYDSSKPDVYFTKDLSPDGVLKIYEKINKGISGKVGIKLHTGEPNGVNLLPREFAKTLQSRVPNSTIVETNTLYRGARYTTEDHLRTLKINGWDFCPVDILDADGDVKLPVNGMREFIDNNGESGLRKSLFVPGVHLTELSVGKNLLNYDFLLVYTHFKGHAMGGFGGSLKNISIGCASGLGGKREIHGDGFPGGKEFLERMVEGGKAITDHFGKNIAYINVAMNISIDCDCNPNGAKPTCDDIGILGSTDVLAVDQAAVDFIYQFPANQRRDIVERIESRLGLHQLDYMEVLGMGSRSYNLVEVS